MNSRQLVLPGMGSGQGESSLPRGMFIHGKPLRGKIRWYFRVHESMPLPREPTAKVIRDYLDTLGLPFSFARTRILDIAEVVIVTGDVARVTVVDNEYWLNPSDHTQLMSLPGLIRQAVVIDSTPDT